MLTLNRIKLDHPVHLNKHLILSYKNTVLVSLNFKTSTNEINTFP